MSKCCDNDKDIESLLTENSIRITSSKVDTLKVFFSSNTPVGSKDILHKLSAYNESTIFRNLAKFKESNILEEIDLNEGYKRYALIQDDHHHHYAQCNKCSEITKLDTCSLNPIAKELQRKGFHIETHKIEVFGTCSMCL